MHPALLPANDRSKAGEILLIGKAGLRKALSGLPAQGRSWARQQGFSAGEGEILPVPGGKDGPGLVLVGLGGETPDAFLLGRLASALPEGNYAFRKAPVDAETALLGFLLSTYSFSRYAGKPARDVRIRLPEDVDGEDLSRIADSVFLARDLINTPSNDMGPEELERAVRQVAKEYKAKVAVTKGAPLEWNYPLIHAVGRASSRAPRLIDLTWGNDCHPRVTLVGKGVCFDTGGLDLKTAAGMLLMKKDMGGGANALALARLIMDAGLPVRLRLLVPAVENSVSGNAFRPGDVYESRKGLTVEIGNTDAEGRLVLADALALADEESPDLLVDFATLTGSARVALGPDLPACFTNDDALADELMAAGRAVNDPVWRMPLWEGYDRMLESRTADLNNVSPGPFAGAITAALFLRRFVEKAKAWAHVDLFAWTPSARPGKPEGGEAQAIRALYQVLKQRHGG